MELPPPHVLLQLDAIIVAQRESDGNNESAVGDADEDDGDTTVAYESSSTGSWCRARERRPATGVTRCASAAAAARHD